MPLTISSPAAEARDLLTQAEAAARAAAVSGVSYSIRLGLTAGGRWLRRDRAAGLESDERGTDGAAHN